MAYTESLAFTCAAIDAAKNGTRDLVAAPGAGYAIWVYKMILVGSAAGTIQLIDSGTNALTGTMPIVSAAQGAAPPIVLDADNPSIPWFTCAENTTLQAVLSANTDLDGSLVYAVVAV